MKDNKSIQKKAQTANVKENAEKMTGASKFFNVLVQLTLVAIAGLIIFKTVEQAGIVLYTFHPVLMAIGYLILVSHGILTMADKNAFTQNFDYHKRITAHWVVQAIALTLITAAQSAIYINKNRNGYPHYQSIHSIFGLITYLTTLSATLGGTFNKYSYSLRNFVKPAVIKVGHAFAGIAVYVLAIATISLGINQTWTSSEDLNVKLGVFVAFVPTTIYVLNKSVKVAYARGKELMGKSKK